MTVTTCSSALHELYPGNCPTCNPQGYEALLSAAPEGQVSEPTFEGAQEQRAWQEMRGAHKDGYSDSY